MVRVGTPAKGEARPTGKSPTRYKTRQDYYASRSGPVVVIVSADDGVTDTRYATDTQRKLVLERDGYRCRYCGDSLLNETANIDHVIPVKHGGKTTLGNLVACCRFCNEAKGNMITMEAPKIGKPTNTFNNPRPSALR